MSGADPQGSWVAVEDLEPGSLVCNPYGGRSGYFTVASAPARAGDVVEVATADGRAGRFRPGFQLWLVRTAEQRARVAAEAEREREAGC